MNNNLFVKGCFGSCWEGNYHYFEPWIGCEHDCAYCYARFRKDVTANLEKFQTNFCVPKKYLDMNTLDADIRREVQEKNVAAVKLSRYTDILTPSFVKDGTSLIMLKSLCESNIKRLIITTKGVPNEGIVTLFKEHKDKISYNIALPPERAIPLESKLKGIEERLFVASQINNSGVKTTVHLDPLCYGIDSISSLEQTLKKAKTYGLNRVMFSFLLLSPSIIKHINRSFGEAATAAMVQYFDLMARADHSEQDIGLNDICIKSEYKNKYIKKVKSLLAEMGFDFVLCPLKNKSEEVDCPTCNGGFYI